MFLSVVLNFKLKLLLLNFATCKLEPPNTSKSHKELEHSELYSYHVELNWLNSYLYSNSVSTRLTSMVRSFGGEVLIDATVRSIIIENGRAVGVRVSNTDELPLVEIRAKISVQPLQQVSTPR